MRVTPIIVCTALCAASVAALVNEPVWARSLESAQMIVGRYACETREAGQPVIRFSSVNTGWGAWLRADTTFRMPNGKPPDIATTYVGFDPSAKQWSIIAIDKDGSYYTRHSTSPYFNGSHWTDNFPADGGTALITVSASRNYTFDFTGAAVKGKIERSHTVCTRVRGQ
jgi:hypothetical protein